MARLPLKAPLIGALTLAVGGAVFSNGGAAGSEEEQAMPTTAIEATLEAHADAMMAIPGVVGVGQGLLGDTPCIKVLVAEKTSVLQQQIPKQVDGHPVVIEQTGEFRALPQR